MNDHLQAIVDYNNIETTCADPSLFVLAFQPQQPSVSYTEPEELEDRFELKKIQLAKKLTDDRKKRAVKNSKEHLEALTASPQLLVGKHVEHSCVSPFGEFQWYKGKVINMDIADGLNTLFTIEYDHATLEEDEPETETFELLKDLQRKDLIIVDKL